MRRKLKAAQAEGAAGEGSAAESSAAESSAPESSAQAGGVGSKEAAQGAQQAQAAAEAMQPSSSKFWATFWNSLPGIMTVVVPSRSK